ncbi:uncharacterized protein LOC130719551 [Lotus japonicus]|uniref:uncharacterized protein LOC130719551 n=1 Tax=Lotus japonicus TaxID=34305 RepID=UPI0025834C37|nr:uncharacterized protein LOC130719551 [Lotus japonicus]
MAGALNPLRSICIGIDPKKDTWRVKVRVLHVWDMFPVGEPSKPYAIHVVLIDVEGVKIEGIIKKGMLKKFRGELVEGSVYRITYFNVISNSGAFRATEHGFKIVFNSRTKVVPDSGETIPTIGLSLKHCAEIGMTLGESDFLIGDFGEVTMDYLQSAKENE